MSALDDLAEAAAEHTAAEQRWLAARDRLILAARREDATWEQVAAAAGMSRAGVINIHAVAAARHQA